MALQLDRLIEWVVGVLREAGDDGLSISTVFARLESESAADDVTKNGVWDGLLARDDVIYSDGKKELPLSKSALALKKLSLDDVYDFNLGERKISTKNHEAAHAAMNVATGSSGVDVTRKNTATKRKASEELFPEPPKKRRASLMRRNDASEHPTAVGPFTPASPSATQVGNLQTSTSTPTHSSLIPSINRKRTKNIKDTEGPPSKKPRAHLPTNVIRRTPKRASPLHTQVQASPRVPEERPTREATFTSQDDLDLQAGISRVYIDPRGSEKPRPHEPQQRGRPKLSCIAVFKSSKLKEYWEKDSEWLDKNKGSWQIAAAAALARANEEVRKAAETAIPKPRIRNNKRESAGKAGEASRSKKRQTSKAAEPSASMEHDNSLEAPVDASEGLKSAVSSSVSNLPPHQSPSAEAIASDEVQPTPATDASAQHSTNAQDSAAAQKNLPLPQQSALAESSPSNPMPNEERTIPAVQIQRRETRILPPPRKTAPKSVTTPTTTSTKTSARANPTLPNQSSAQTPPQLQENSAPCATQLQTAATPPPEDSTAPTQIVPPGPTPIRRSLNHTVSYVQNGERTASMLTPIVPGAVANQPVPSSSIESLQNEQPRQTSFAWLIADSYSQSNGSGYTSPYQAPSVASASPSVRSQSALYTPGQMSRAPVGTFNGHSQTQNSASPAQTPSTPSDADASKLSTVSVGPPTHTPVPTSTAASIPPPRHGIPSNQNMLAQLLTRPISSYTSPYASYNSPYNSPYKSPYTSQSGLQAYQLPGLPHSVPLAQSQPPEQTPTRFPRGVPLSEDPIQMGPSSGEERFTSQPHPDGRILVSPVPLASPRSAAPRPAGQESPKKDSPEVNSQENLNQVKPRKPRKPRSKPQQDPELVTKLSQAESIAPPEGATRLACVFKELCGNLLLSKDLTVLEFTWAVVQPLETPTLVLPISQVSQNPITSMPGSNPMELRIKAKDDNGEEVTHCFIFAGTDVGTEAANAMRSKIVTALIAHQFRTGGSYERPEEVQLEIEKPFKCDKCSARFKNKGGLDYHLTKSNTTCNPNCDLKLLAERTERAEKRKNRPPRQPKDPNALKLLPRPRKNKAQAEKVLPERKAMTPVALEDAEESDSSTSSEDSIIEFWKQNSTSGFERPRKVSFGGVTKISPRKSNVYKALPFETSILREIATETAVVTKTLDDVDNTLGEASTRLLEPSTTEQLDSQRSEEILLSLVHDNHDIFPGDRSIWIAFVGVWLKQHTGSLVLPESKFCSKTVDDLVESKKLKSMKFTFVDTKNRVITRTILTSPGYQIKSPAVDMLKGLIKVSHPGFYVPNQFAPPEPALSKLIALATRKLTDRDKYRIQESADVESEPTDSRPQSPVEFGDESSGDEFVGDGVGEEDLLDDLSSGEEEGLSETEENEEDEEAEKKVVKRKKGSKPPRSAAHNKAISDGVRRSWAKIKATKDSGFFSNRKPRNGRVPLTQEEKDKRAHNAVLRQQTWADAPAFMPNPETGAWDQLPAKPKKSRKGGRRVARVTFPEPITWLQATNGAWSVRAFGHGVKPIHARPSRRADGNPLAEAYRRRVEENGFRPIMMPTKSRLYLPAIPSKVLLQGRPTPHPASRWDFKDGQRISKVTGKPVRIYRKRTPSSQSPDSERGRTSKGIGKPRAGAYGSGFPRRVPTDVHPTTSTRHSIRGTKILDEVHLLNFFEPKKLELEPDGLRNLGLETIPPIFGMDASQYEGADPGEYDYAPKYGEVVFIEPRIIEEGLNAGNGSWTVGAGAWTPAISEDFNIRWDDATAFDLETIPYEHLDFGRESIEGEDIVDEPRPSKRQNRHFVPYRTLNTKKLTAAEKYSFVRVLTSLPTDFEGVLKDPQDAHKEFGVQVAPPNQATMESRRIKGLRAIMPPELERRFITTVVVICTLTGGLDLKVDWVLVSQHFQEYSCNFLTNYWKRLQQARKKAIELLVADFQAAFLPAYQSGKVPRLDFENLVGYDWKRLIDWVMKNVDTTLNNKPVIMPGTKQEMMADYDFGELDPDPNRWREAYFGIQMPIYRRIEAAAAEPYTVHSRRDPPSSEIDEFILARSWVRATALTPEKDYDKRIGGEKVNQLGSGLVTEALTSLVKEKLLVKRARNRAWKDRWYQATDKFFAPLRKLIKEPMFLQAITFKRFLDEQFSGGAKCVRHEYVAKEGHIMVTSTLQALGRIRLVPVGVPMKKFGLIDGGGYETRTIPHEKLTFEMDIYPTDSYIFDSDNKVLNTFFETEPPHGPDNGAIPAWYGLSDKLIPDVWKKVLMGVGQIAALRSGIDVAGLRKIFKPTLDEWEIRLLMEWGTEVGLFKRLHESIEGWSVGDDWWLLVGRTVEMANELNE